MRLTRAFQCLLPLSILAMIVRPVSSQDLASISQAATKASVLIVASDATGKPFSQGSGFVVSKDGKLVTNLHVVRGAATAAVKFPDGAFYDVGGFIAEDPSCDIVILKIRADGKEFPFLQLAQSDEVTIGQHVIAIGSPLSLQNTVSDGIVSALRNASEIDPKSDPNLRVFQTTVPVSPGSSGGALLNMQGQAIGITSFEITGGQNLNFAIPVSCVRPLLPRDAIKPLAELSPPPPKEAPLPELAQLAGTYTGVWQSRLSGSGGLVMVVKIEAGVLHADVKITGGARFKGDSMIATGAKDMGNGVWTVDLKAEHSKMIATGIFKPGSFVGDFSYHYSPIARPDRGQWIVSKP